MADLAARIPDVAGRTGRCWRRAPAFWASRSCVKAGMWPLCFWLPTTYAAASPPVASIFAILTKVGVYVVLRLWLLLFGEDAGASAQFGGEWLLFGGMATVAFGTIGTLASQDMARLAAFSVLVSSGTVLAAIGMGQVGVTGGALFYMVSSTLGISAFFLLIELVERGREPGADVLAVTRRGLWGRRRRLRRRGRGRHRHPGHHGSARACLHRLRAGDRGAAAAVRVHRQIRASDRGAQPIRARRRAAPSRRPSWALLVLLILSGLAALIAMTRAGIRAFWASTDRAVPRVRLIEMAPIVVLLILCAMQTIQAGPVMRFMQATAESLHAPQSYVRDVLAASRARDAQGGRDMTRLRLSRSFSRPSDALAAAQSGAFVRAYPSRQRARRLSVAGH